MNWAENILAPLINNWPLVGVAVWGIIVAIKTLRVLREQTEATRKAAEATQASVNTLVDSERAWLVVIAESPCNLSRTKNTWIYQGFGFEWRVKNCGRTPAHIKRIGARFHSVRNFEELPREPNIEIPGLFEPTEHYPYGLIAAPGDSPIERFTMFTPPPRTAI